MYLVIIGDKKVLATTVYCSDLACLALPSSAAKPNVAMLFSVTSLRMASCQKSPVGQPHARMLNTP